jgi:hypothetical protein
MLCAEQRARAVAAERAFRVELEMRYDVSDHVVNVYKAMMSASLRTTKGE